MPIYYYSRGISDAISSTKRDILTKQNIPVNDLIPQQPPHLIPLIALSNCGKWYQMVLVSVDLSYINARTDGSSIVKYRTDRNYCAPHKSDTWNHYCFVWQYLWDENDIGFHKK